MPTIAATLERQRLIYRADRIQRVLAALHERRDDRVGAGAVPEALDLSIAEFTRQLSHLEEDLRVRASSDRREAG